MTNSRKSPLIAVLPLLLGSLLLMGCQEGGGAPGGGAANPCCVTVQDTVSEVCQRTGNERVTEVSFTCPDGNTIGKLTTRWYLLTCRKYKTVVKSNIGTNECQGVDCGKPSVTPQGAVYYKTEIVSTSNDCPNQPPAGGSEQEGSEGGSSEEESPN